MGLPKQYGCKEIEVLMDMGMDLRSSCAEFVYSEGVAARFYARVELSSWFDPSFFLKLRGVFFIARVWWSHQEEGCLSSDF